jgi:signal recognition particle receptor subunit beta
VASYDSESDTVVIRIVYDGLGTAGKTTNVDRIYEQFSVARKGDVYSPEVVRGRTLYFDWLELSAGRVCGKRLKCQVVTVPGQLAFVQRRWELLRHPDAIVAVCDSDPTSLRRARVGLSFLRKTLATRAMRDVPLVVQANKQDLAGALSVTALADALDIRPPIPIVPAVARTGIGVRQTLLEAIHAAADRVRVLLDESGAAALPRDAERPQELYERLKSLEDTQALAEGARLADEVLEEEEWER